MSWDCPYYNDDICQLNGLECKPGKGYCVLKGRYRIQHINRPEPEKPKKKDSEQKTAGSQRN